MNYVKDNIESVKFVYKKFGEKLLTIFCILFVPLVLVFIVVKIWNFDFSLVFSYIFGVYGIIITVILFDYILVSEVNEAKYFNSDEEIKKISKDLEFIKELMMSDKELPIKVWKDKLANLSTYNNLLKKNDKILLSSKKDDFDDVIQKLKKIDLDFGSSENMVNFSEADRFLSTECNDRLQQLIVHIRMKKGVK
ncbi:hypothetical protein [Staphylococcus xylosus]|uniref:hypothetical protein n=1 Tax=Staphylococcus xylosus TaxID=1288 RepID=UPI003F562B06